jgi:CRISPR/Cas system-associated endoribonuclease Cas2
MQEKIISSIKEFINKDKDDLILVRNNEMCFSHRIGVYLEKYFK